VGTGQKGDLDACWQTLKRTLRRLGWRYRRTRRATAKAPAAHRVAAARKALAKLRALEAAGRCALFYGDESGFCLQPTLSRSWQPPGPTLALPAQAHGKRLNVVGFLRGRDGELAHVAREGRLGAAEFIEAVESRLLPGLRGHGRPAVLVLDNGPCHRNRLVRAKRAEWRAKGLRLLFLPPYCPHLNRIETLWRMVKHRWLGPAAYASFSTLRQGVTSILDQVGLNYRVSFA
jgi:transposase InsO family protein